MEQPRGGKAAGRAGVIESHQLLRAMNRAPSTLPNQETRRGRMIEIERRGSRGREVSDVSTRRESDHAWTPRERQRSTSAQQAVSKTSEQSGNTVARTARRRAPCKVRSGRRRREVPRLLLWWRGAGSTISGMQHQHSGKRRARMPNPSLKRSANGRPPGPGLRYAVHFLSPGQGVLPLVPPQLKR